jgi:RHS repeat-associated protein
MATRTQGPSSATFGYRYGGRQYSYATNFGGEAPETLQYRGDGRLYSRASGATTKVFRYDRGWNAIDEEDGAGNLTATSVYAPGAAVGERLAWVSGTMLSGTWDYAYHDQLGSTRRWRSATKALLGADDFGPFGEPLATSTVAPIDYALHAQDPYTLMYHAAYREYAAGWARWTTRDPLGMVDGPNVYGYVGDAPISWTDLLGLCCPDDPDTTKGSPDVAACKDKIDALTTKANLALDLAETAALAGCLRVPSWQGKLLCTAAVTTTCSLTRSKIAKLDAEEKHRCEIDPCGLLPNVDAPINLPLPSSPPYTFTP